ncbi:7753_t:CDS:2 [Dentiscutata erythropus]|uniref:7753_t:CDS:1 n=1 Tax=Dentiscutata erythropus TaxID=1348616 RepID=A0A9N9EH44_9GLOM|nr:7753_t:CDS:2 [Dentiscutata erythropus]
MKNIVEHEYVKKKKKLVVDDVDDVVVAGMVIEAEPIGWYIYPLVPEYPTFVSKLEPKFPEENPLVVVVVMEV